jgi:hypothetical protein
LHEKSIIAIVIVIVADFLAFVFREYASKPIRDVRNIDGENLVVLRAGHRKTIYR